MKVDFNIDLIDEGDIIMFRYNGETYVSIVSKYKDKKVLKMHFNYFITITGVEILKIMTKEQFESMAYEVK